MRRLILSPRWILWHVLTLGAVVTCIGMSAWQWERAGSAMGSALNIGYGLQWPLFAVFFAVMWWRFLQLELTGGPAQDDAPEDRGQPSEANRTGRPDAAPSPFGPRPAGARPAEIPQDSTLAAYNRMLGELAERDAGQR